jgi:hypothetical protein
MKLDFLKRGVINTANFIPKFAFGDMNMHPAVLVINIIGRLLAVYLCFQFNSDLDIKSLILAILFPTLYIMYSIAVHGVDRVLDIFGFERNTFEDIFKDSPDKCEERRGPDGDLPSIPGDKTACESVTMGQSDSRIRCEAVQSTDTTTRGTRRNNYGVCEYTGDGSTNYRTCNDLGRQQICDNSELNCSWREFPEETVYNRCNQLWEINGGSSRGISFEKCPTKCPYYFNEQGFIQIPIIANNTMTLANSVAGAITVGATASTTNLALGAIASQNTIVIKETVITTAPNFFKPLRTNDYKEHEILLFDKESSYGLLNGKIKYIQRSSESAPGDVTSTEAQSVQLSTDFSDDTFIYIGEWALLGATTETKAENIATLLDANSNIGAQITLKTNENTCGEEFTGNSGGLRKVTSVAGSNSLGLADASSVPASFDSQLTGKCQSR